MVGVDTHALTQRYRNPQKPPGLRLPTTTSSSRRSIKGHIWPLTLLESTLIGGKCSQCPAGTMLSGQREVEEGGYVDKNRGEEEEGENSLSLLFPSLPPSSSLFLFSVCPSVHTDPSWVFNVATGQEPTFLSGDVRNWDWQRNDPPPWVKESERVEERGTVSFTLGVRAHQKEIQSLK